MFSELLFRSGWGFLSLFVGAHVGNMADRAGFPSITSLNCKDSQEVQLYTGSR
jgi:hypothetical protein